MQKEIKLSVVIDSREPEKIEKKFIAAGVEVEKKFLLVGDIISGDICIERKAIADFVHSFHGHIWTQLQNMHDNYKHNYLIIVGKYADLYFMGVKCTIEQYLGAIASIAVNYNVKVVQVDNEQQFVSVVIKLIEKHNNPVKHIVIEKLSNEDDVYLRMLRQIPGVGQKRAIELLEHYDFKELYELQVEDLKDVVGDKTAQNIKKWLF